VIPQNPVLFSGTLRQNLDPWDRHGDDAIFKALNHVKLLERFQGPHKNILGSQVLLEARIARTKFSSSSFNEIHNQLSTFFLPQVCESGTNFTMGERLLILLARSILNQNRIIVLEETTSNVDKG
jgi:ABC-type multidrug transport system fused ATPase/permease subunit